MSRQTERRIALLASKEEAKKLRANLHGFRPRTEIDRLKDDASRQLNYAYDRMQEVLKARMALVQSIHHVEISAMMAAIYGKDKVPDFEATRPDSLERYMNAAIHALTERGIYPGDTPEISQAKNILEMLRGEHPVEDMEDYMGRRNPFVAKAIQSAREGLKVQKDKTE